VLEQNFFVEVHMPNGILRALSAEEMAAYGKPFASPGEDRRPTLKLGSSKFPGFPKRKPPPKKPPPQKSLDV